MGQYYCPVNLDKREFFHPHRLDVGLKLLEMLDSPVATAVLLLQTNFPGRRGGGDPEHSYNGMIGRWRGDRVVIVGDYAKDGDWPESPVPLGKIYGLCPGKDPSESFTDISDDVRRMLDGVYAE